ncbi:hypothetical protein PC123_g24635 [Phytophthora cactorum]|nr:hypothetical protein PC123_g24635 [Phytophthora cactorum]
MHCTICPYVPAYKDDIIYTKPTPQQGDAAKATKPSRDAHRAAMAITAKENCDGSHGTLHRGSESFREYTNSQ